jgi:putative aldouronate transport system permease protein
MMPSEDRIASVVPEASPELVIVSPRASVRSPRVRGRRYRQGAGLGYFLLFNYVPMAGQVIAFKDYVMSDGVFGSTWVGLDNFRRLFDSADFPRVLRNTLTISLLRLAFGFLAPCILALLLHELRLAWYRRSIQTLTYLPYFFSWVILGGIFSMLLSGAGPVNRMILLVSARPVNFLTDDRWFVAVLVLTGIWQSAGWGSVLYLAALVGVDPGLYEAACIDGANRWQQMRHITLPALTPTMLTLFILSLSGILSAGFDQVYNLYNPLVYNVGDIIDTYVLRRMMDLDFSLATAAGMFKGVVGLVLIVLANSVVQKLTHGQEGIY